MDFEDTQEDKLIKKCIDHCDSFHVVAGAGSGKTGSLVKALNYVRKINGVKLAREDKKIACITYTNIAVEVLKSRTDQDDIFKISTVHAFLWRIVKDYQDDLAILFYEFLLPLRIKNKEKDIGGNSKKAIAAREKIEHLNSILNSNNRVSSFSYDINGRRDYCKGKLDHDDIIDLSCEMILKFSNLRKILSHKYPYIFIDEAQDTFPNVIESLNLVASENESAMVGYFGDPMQQIYDKRAGDFSGPEGSILIKKKFNYRCSHQVIGLLNAMRPDLQQIPGEINEQGSVEIRLISAEKGEAKRNAYSTRQKSEAVAKFNSAVEHFGWLNDTSVKRLFLTHQMISHRLGFSNLNKLFTGDYSSKSSEDSFKDGSHFFLAPFIETIIPVAQAYQNNDWTKISFIMRNNSPLLDPEGVSKDKTLKQVSLEFENSVEGLIKKLEEDSVRSVLEFSIGKLIIAPCERIQSHLQRPPRDEEYNELTHAKEKGEWLADCFFEMKTQELFQYQKFVLNETPYRTQHGVKGEEFDKVLVVFDDTEASWTHYSFSKLFAPLTSGKKPTEGQRVKSHNLSYVSFSRAEKDLRIILFTADPIKTKEELISSGLFSSRQITIQ